MVSLLVQQLTTLLCVVADITRMHWPPTWGEIQCYEIRTIPLEFESASLMSMIQHQTKPWKQVMPKLHSCSLLYTFWSERSVAINLLQVLPPVKVQNKEQNLFPCIRQLDIKVSAAIHACSIPGLFTLQGYW